jgi:3-deoxy-D-manno-octulosonic-acid transferase
VTRLLTLYQRLTRAGTPLIHVHIKRRMRRGKEDAARINERFGIASVARPAGRLVWLHAASIGEALSALSFLSLLNTRYPSVQLLFTTGTVTSATLLATKLPAGAIHQFMPVDTPVAVARFLDHWKPDAGLFLESELWPNMLMEAKKRGIRLALLNARMSETSMRNWGYAPDTIAELLSSFTMILAQSEADRRRYETLARVIARNSCSEAIHSASKQAVDCFGLESPRNDGGKEQHHSPFIHYVGNLKHDAAPLATDADTLAQLKTQLTGRPIFVGASLHPSEEIIFAQAALALKKQHADLLAILIPRHPERGKEMEASIGTLPLITARRSLAEAITEKTDIYIADTIGELGLWYRLADAVLIGGSLIAHGGQNPLEPIRLGAPVMFGTHMFNFEPTASELLAAGAAVRVESTSQIAACAQQWFSDEAARRAVIQNATAWLAAKPPVAEAMLKTLHPMLLGAT